MTSDRPAGYSHPSTAPGTAQPPGSHPPGFRGSQAYTSPGLTGSQVATTPTLTQSSHLPRQTSLQGGPWLGFLASTRVPMHAPGHLAATHASHMDRGRPAPPHGSLCVAAEGKHRKWQSFTRADFTTRSCRALTRARTHSRQQGASQLRICEGYDQPTLRPTH